MVFSQVRAPREDGWGEVVSEVVLDRDTFSPVALNGLSEFSHVKVLFHLHGISASSVVTERRHPEATCNGLKSVFLPQTAQSRPNRIAATICRLLSIQDLTLKVQGLDAYGWFSRLGHQARAWLICCGTCFHPAAEMVARNDGEILCF